MAMFGRRTSGKAATDSSGRTDVTHPGSSPAQKREAAARASQPMPGKTPLKNPFESKVLKIDSSSNSNPAPTLSRREQKRKDKALKGIEPLTPAEKGDWDASENGFKRSNAARDYDFAKFSETRASAKHVPPTIGGVGSTREDSQDVADTYKKFGTLSSSEAIGHQNKLKKDREQYR